MYLGNEDRNLCVVMEFDNFFFKFFFKILNVCMFQIEIKVYSLE